MVSVAKTADKIVAVREQETRNQNSEPEKISPGDIIVAETGLLIFKY
jgi:hypothetical protein